MRLAARKGRQLAILFNRGKLDDEGLFQLGYAIQRARDYLDIGMVHPEKIPPEKLRKAKELLWQAQHKMYRRMSTYDKTREVHIRAVA